MKIPKVSDCSSSWQRCCKHKKRNKKAKEYSPKRELPSLLFICFRFPLRIAAESLHPQGLGQTAPCRKSFFRKRSRRKSLCIRRRDWRGCSMARSISSAERRTMVCSTPRRKYAVTSSPFLLMARPFCSSTGTRGTGRPPVTSGQTGITTCPLRKSRTA